MPEPRFLDAVLQAEQHDFLYFCARADLSGYSEFARTYEQHQVNARSTSGPWTSGASTDERRCGRPCRGTAARSGPLFGHSRYFCSMRGTLILLLFTPAACTACSGPGGGHHHGRVTPRVRSSARSTTSWW
jgi:hypothetical protein